MRTLQSADHVVVVGAGLAGWRFVEALRQHGFAGALTLVGEETYPPYDRPPLSKQVLSGKWPIDHTALTSPEHVAGVNVRLRLGVAATGLDVANTTVHLSDGTSLVGSHVVVATGARARQLPFSALERLHTVRTRGDVERLNDDLSSAPPAAVVAIIGGGFIGAEVATALKTRGFTPIVLEQAPRPLIDIVGPEVSSWLADLAGAANIELRTSQRVADVVEAPDGLAVLFEDGGVLGAYAVVVGAGAQVNVEWLATSGLTIDHGVVVDEHLLATERVAAIGDVARFQWPNVAGSELVRIEHWQVANDHAASLARYWVTGEGPATLLVPYFWSDQYGQKIQMLGHPRASDNVTRVSRTLDGAKWMALFSRSGCVTGVVTLGNPRALMLSKPLLDATTTLEDALARAPWAT